MSLCSVSFLWISLCWVLFNCCDHFCYVYCHYVECCNAQCHYIECCLSLWWMSFCFVSLWWIALCLLLGVIMMNSIVLTTWCHYDEWHCAYYLVSLWWMALCLLLGVIMMNGIVLSVITMNVRAVVDTDQFQYSHILYSFTKPAILIRKPTVQICPVTERSVPTMPIMILSFNELTFFIWCSASDWCNLLRAVGICCQLC
jgi:hypothetical protein